MGLLEMQNSLGGKRNTCRRYWQGTLVLLLMQSSVLVKTKQEVVSQDEKESGLRAALNLGHTFGHAIETGFGYGQWLHGEAVAAGMVVAVDLSYRLGWIEDSLVKRVDRILKQAKLPTAPPDSKTVEMCKSVMVVEKKVADGLLRLDLSMGRVWIRTRPGSVVFFGYGYKHNSVYLTRIWTRISLQKTGIGLEYSILTRLGPVPV